MPGCVLTPHAAVVIRQSLPLNDLDKRQEDATPTTMLIDYDTLWSHVRAGENCANRWQRRSHLRGRCEACALCCRGSSWVQGFPGSLSAKMTAWPNQKPVSRMATDSSLDGQEGAP